MVDSSRLLSIIVYNGNKKKRIYCNNGCWAYFEKLCILKKFNDYYMENCNALHVRDHSYLICLHC